MTGGLFPAEKAHGESRGHHHDSRKDEEIGTGGGSPRQDQARGLPISL